MEPLQTWWATELYPTSDEDNFGVVGNFEVVKAADAQATIAALQARVQELEARQHFGACAKCLTNAWRICKEGTPDAVEMKCSNGSTWWLCDYCLSKEQLTQRTAERDTARRRVDELEAREVDVVLLRDDLEQRTAELERVRGERYDMQRAAQGMSNDLTGIGQKYDELRTLIAALPKVEGAVVVSNGYVKDSTRCHALFGADEDAASYAALLQHRQGMEG